MKASAVPRKLLRYWNEQVTRPKRSGALSTGLLILSSAALGGIAVALWNRKTLTTFHELEQHRPPAPEPFSYEIEDFFEDDPADRLAKRW